VLPINVATSSVIKMPRHLPDIVKSYKSVYAYADRGISNTGVRVKQGDYMDYITILAKGTIPSYF